jgi:hypothetical protein
MWGIHVFRFLICNFLLGGIVLKRVQFKNILVGFLIGSIFFSGVSFAATKTLKKAYFNNIKIIVDGKQLIAEYPVMTVETKEDSAGKTYVTARELAEALGAKVDWDGKNNTIVVTSGKVSATTELETVTNSKYVFDLTDDEINEAIELGKKGVTNTLNYEKDNYRITPNQSVYNVFIEKLQIVTPYLHIMRNSAMKAYKYETYSFDDAKAYLNSCKKTDGFYFDMLYNCSKIDSHKNLNIVLKQGDKVIKPFAINGRDTLADMTNSWPDFPAYQASISVTFSNAISKDIDFSKKAQLVIIHAPEMESVFEVDFSKYK